MIIPQHYQNLNVLHENTLPARSYYVPASVDKGSLVHDRAESDRFQLLNGTWKFKYFDSIYDVRDEFYASEFIADDFDSIPVPSVWQNHGFDRHQYTNIRYPIPLDPPFVPHENPAGAYITEFEYSPDDAAPLAHLNFEGVDSCFYVWVNGEYVGYSQVTHATAEFDITDQLVSGNNKLAVLVLKWCDGTYLEDQDKFRTSGIFRDVYLLKRPTSRLTDFFTTTTLAGGSAHISVRAYFEGDAATRTTAHLKDVAGRHIASAGFETVKGQQEFPFVAQLEIENPQLWNAEEPYLYTLVLESENETIVDRIGVREISVENNVVKLNGQPIKFRGVNRHDSDPVAAPALDIEHIKRDLTLIKEHNFNAVRSSHYPNSPFFYQLCDEIGLYVMCEADNESHGASTQYLQDGSLENQMKHWNERISDNPQWNEPTLDRMQLCVRRDKNRPSVVIWSAGNEGGYGCTFENALKWVKEYDSTRLTHYESAFHDDGKRTYDYSNLDFYARMYPAISEVQDYLDSKPDKPFLLMEYCHAMGNGPGDFEDYWKLIYTNDAMAGGFVWEWCDHAIDKGQDARTGKTKYFYGGDHGEDIHDGNFCMDGLVYPDRTPHISLYEYQNVHRPMRVESFDATSGQVVLRNYLDFTDISEFARVRFEVTHNGEVISHGEAQLPSIAPHQTGTLSLSLPEIPAEGSTYLKLTYTLAYDHGLLKAGHFLGFDEIALAEKLPAVPGGADASAKQKLTVETADRTFTISGEGFTYTFNRLTGVFDQLTVGRKDLLTQASDISIWRAPTDNDMYIRTEWERAEYDRARPYAYSAELQQTDAGVEISARIGMVAPTVQRILLIDASWRVDASGAIFCRLDAHKALEFPDLPRFGVRFFVDKALGQVTYRGLGPYENYADKKRASYHGTFSTTVEDLHEDYVTPQENGARGDCELVQIDGEGAGLDVYAISRTLSFNASRYTAEELTDAAHNYELEESDSTVLVVDYAHNGIGSNSCGPEVLDEYRFNATSFTHEFAVVPR